MAVTIGEKDVRREVLGNNILLKGKRRILVDSFSTPFYTIYFLPFHKGNVSLGESKSLLHRPSFSQQHLNFR